MGLSNTSQVPQTWGTTTPPRACRVAIFLVLALFSSAVTLVMTHSDGRATGSRARPFVGSAGVPERVAGSDRYATAVEVARQSGGGSLTGLSDLIIVSGEGFADALVASGLAGYLDTCPRPNGAQCGRTAILLTRATILPRATQEAITASKVPASRITVIGGTSVISDAVRGSIAVAAGWKRTGTNPAVRVSGRNRYETAAAVAERVRSLASRQGGIALPDSFRTVLIATGENFPDALSAGTLAYRAGHLLLLAQPNALPSVATDAIRALNANCGRVVGGPGVLSEQVITGLRRAITAQSSLCGDARIAGSDRFETAGRVADELIRRHARPGEEVEVLLASGTSFADALTATTLTRGRVLLLSQSTRLPAATRQWILTRPDRIASMTVVGGPRAVSSSTAIEANNPSPSPMGTTKAPKMIPGPPEVAAERCRIPQNATEAPSSESYAGRHSTAFPVNFENLLPNQEVSLVTIPIDWADYPADPADLPSKHDHVNIFIDYYERVSGGQLRFTTNFATRWYRMPEPISQYPQVQASDFNSKLAQHAINAADPDLDFSTIDIVIFVFPDFPPIPVTSATFPFASLQHFNSGGSRNDPRSVFSNEGFVRNYAGGANYFDHRIRPVWSYYIHEVAHMFSLPDWYMREANTTNSEFLPDLDYAIGPLSNWGVMSSQDGPSRTFVAWSRWLMGWLSEEQVACYELSQLRGHGPFTTELVALDVYEPGVKAVMIRTGAHSGLVIESRRPVFPDHDLVYLEPFGRKPQGLIVYRVDATKGNSEGTLILVPPTGQTTLPLQLSGRFDARMIDALYNVGASATVSGLRIELISSGSRDVVRISPA